MAKKIIPALFHLYSKKRLPDKLKIVGFSRRAIPQLEFQEYAKNLAEKNSHIQPDEKKLGKFAKMFSYQQGNFDKKEDYLALENYLEQIEKGWKLKANKLFYLAVPPTLYEGIFAQLANSQIASQHNGFWTRIVVEKPFGRDLATAEKLDELLGRLFREDQIYRIDHYLGKELLQNILAFRFSNNLLEHSWNNGHIESIEIKLNEITGVEDRGDTYDAVGALRDVGQNHLLQMLALVTMDNPGKFSSDNIRSNRAKALQSLKPLNSKEIQQNTFRSQYQGYKETEGVKKDSQTETYFRLRGELASKRWKRVLFTLESGKRLDKLQKEIIITFRHPSPCLCPANKPHLKNKIIFTLEPKEEIKIIFWAKKPGLTTEVEERAFDFSYRKETGKDDDYTAEYEKLLLDCLLGDQTLFVSTEEVRAMWKFIDSVVKAWDSNLVPLAKYFPKTQLSSGKHV